MRHRGIALLAGVLVIVISVVSCVGLSRAIDKLPDESMEQTYDTNADVNISTDSTEADFTYSYAGDELKCALINNADGTEAYFCVTTNKLEPNTKYVVRWKINAMVEYGTNAYLFSETIDGTEQFYVTLDTSYTAYSEGEWGLRLASSRKTEVFNGEYEFTSEAEGDDFLLALLRFPFANGEEDANIDQLLAEAAVIDTYIESVTITKVTEEAGSEE